MQSVLYEYILTKLHYYMLCFCKKSGTWYLMVLYYLKLLKHKTILYRPHMSHYIKYERWIIFFLLCYIIGVIDLISQESLVCCPPQVFGSQHWNPSELSLDLCCIQSLQASSLLTELQQYSEKLGCFQIQFEHQFLKCSRFRVEVLFLLLTGCVPLNT